MEDLTDERSDLKQNATYVVGTTKIPHSLTFWNPAAAATVAAAASNAHCWNFVHHFYGAYLLASSRVVSLTSSLGLESV